MIDRDRLGEAVSQLDPGTRALLDLSLRRAVPDESVASVLGVDPASIPPRRARGIAQLADMLEIPGPAELAAMLIAIPELPESAWGVPEAKPFGGGVSRARRAGAFRRVAVTASPLVALGAVIAALLVSSGSNHSERGSLTLSATGPRAGRAPSSLPAQALDARHGLPPGARLVLGVPGTHSAVGSTASHGPSSAHAAVSAEHTTVASHQPAAARAELAAFHPSRHHHEPRSAPRHKPSHAPHGPQSHPRPEHPEAVAGAPADDHGHGKHGRKHGKHGRKHGASDSAPHGHAYGTYKHGRTPPGLLEKHGS